MEKDLRIGVVGPCAAGKSTLISELSQRGYHAKQIAQEHSYVPDMWKRLTNPDILIYLDVSYEISLRRKKLNWSKKEYEIQKSRLSHAREYADLYINTDNLTIDKIVIDVLKAIRRINQY